MRGAGRLFQTLIKIIFRILKVWAAGEMSGYGLVGVDDEPGALRRDRLQCQVAGCDQGIAAQYQVCRATIKVHCADSVGGCCQPDMTGDGTTFLSHAKLVDCLAGLPFQMGSHGDHGADRDDAGAADTRTHSMRL